MPEYRGVRVELTSQFDIVAIPEFQPGPQEVYQGKEAIKLLNPLKSIVTVYVPRLPSSQFWINYSAVAPEPPTAFYYFKLSINNEHIVSWGCGEEHSFKGKTMFGLYETESTREGEKGYVGKHSLFFSRTNTDATAELEDPWDDKQFVEVRVYRSNARKRIPLDLEEFKDTYHGRNGGTGVDLITAGEAKKDIPKRFYKYALLDALDEPFITFRFYHRTWEQLSILNVGAWHGTVDHSGVSSRLSQYTAGSGLSALGTSSAPENCLNRSEDCGEYACNSVPGETQKHDGRSRELLTSFRSLSFPPTRVIVTPPSPPPAPPAPPAPPSNLYDKPLPAEPAGAQVAHMNRRWNATIGTQGQGQVDRLHPPPGRKRASSAVMLNNVVANAMRRRANT